MRRTNGLTLLELLTSVSVALVLTVLATVAFVQIRATLQRMHVRVEMHNSARFLYQHMSEAVGCLQQDGATWLESTADDGSHHGSVSLTFLRGRMDEHGYTTNQGDIVGGEEWSAYQNRCSDLSWCSFKWDQARGIIYAGTNSLPHQFKIATPWAGAVDYGSFNIFFLYMPQPLRQAEPYPAALPVGSSQAALNGNRYGSPDTRDDLSDYQDLQSQLAPVLRHVTKCVIELVLADGTTVDGDVEQTRTIGLDGCYVDGRAFADATGTKPYRRRPRLVRILVDMTDPVTGVMQSFSFSFQPPGPLPSSFPQGEQIP